MVRIKKGDKEKVVASSAYKNFYEGAGWHIVGKSSRAKVRENNSDDEISDEEWDDAMADDDEPSKPLSEMNRSELEALAEKMGVSLVGLSNNKQIREAIKAAM